MRRLIGSILFIGLLIGLAVLAALARPAQGPAEAATAPAASSLRVAAAPTPAQQQRDAVSAPAMTNRETEKNSAVPTAVQKPNDAGTAPAISGKETEKKPVAVPAAPATTSKYNVVALPLDVSSNWNASGIPFSAQGLAQYIGLASVTQVLRWDTNRQAYDQWFPADGYGFVGGAITTTAYTLVTGGAYRLLIGSSNPTLNSVSFVGEVPAASSIKFTLHGASACKYNQLSIPLEQSSLTDSGTLAASLGGATKVSQVLRWDSSRQAYDQWFPAGGYGFVGGAIVTSPWVVNLGYPYVVCLLAGAEGTLWP